MKIITILLTWVILIQSAIASDSGVTLCVDEFDYPPYWHSCSSTDSGKSFDCGVSAEITAKIFEHMGTGYNVVRRPWVRCLDMVEFYDVTQNDKAEIVVDASYSKERESRFLLTDSVYTTHQGVFYSRKKFPNGLSLKKPEDLKGLSICGVHGNNYDELKEVGVFDEVDDGAMCLKSALRKLSAGRCDVHVGSVEFVYGGANLGHYNIPEGIDYVIYPGSQKPSFHYAISKGAPRAEDLREKMNQAIRYLRDQGILSDIIESYLSIRISNKP